MLGGWLSVLASCLGLAACAARGRDVPPTTYELPAGFTGWVQIEFGVAGAPPLPSEDGRRIVRIPADGALATSSPQVLGVVDHRFDYVDAGGRRTPIDDVEGRPGADPGAAYQRHDHVVVLGFRTAVMDGRRYFEQFYVGTGPAGDSPPLR